MSRGRCRLGGLVSATLLLCAQAATAGSTAENAEFPQKDTPEAVIYRGHIVFSDYCQKCHGPNADGNGRAARLYDPRPANLVRSDKNDRYKELIIRRGGTAMSRSEFMPPWQDELTDEQISDVVGYLHSVAEKHVE